MQYCGQVSGARRECILLEYEGLPQWVGGNALCNIADRLAALDENVYYLSRMDASMAVW